MATAWVLILALKILWMLVVPTIVIIAAFKLWNSTPRWISAVFFASAVVGLAASTPPILIHLHKLSVQQYGEIAIPFAIANTIARFTFAVAVLVLAIKMKRMTEQKHKPDCS
jgi:hypothetical protein